MIRPSTAGPRVEIAQGTRVKIVRGMVRDVRSRANPGQRQQRPEGRRSRSGLRAALTTSAHEQRRYSSMLQFSPVRTAIIALVAVLVLTLCNPQRLQQDQLAACQAGCHQGMTLWVSTSRAARICYCRSTRGFGRRRSAEEPAARRPSRGRQRHRNRVSTDATGLTIELTDPTQKQAALTALRSSRPAMASSASAASGTGLRRNDRQQDHRDADARGINVA